MLAHVAAAALGAGGGGPAGCVPPGAPQPCPQIPMCPLSPPLYQLLLGLAAETFRLPPPPPPFMIRAHFIATLILLCCNPLPPCRACALFEAAWLGCGGCTLRPRPGIAHLHTDCWPRYFFFVPPPALARGRCALRAAPSTAPTPCSIPVRAPHNSFPSWMRLPHPHNQTTNEPHQKAHPRIPVHVFNRPLPPTAAPHMLAGRNVLPQRKLRRQRPGRGGLAS